MESLLITSNVMALKSLTLIEKLVLTDIKRLSAMTGKCKKSDEHWSHNFGVGLATVSRAVKKLESLGLISRESKKCQGGTDRLITLNNEALSAYLSLNRVEPYQPKKPAKSKVAESVENQLDISDLLEPANEKRELSYDEFMALPMGERKQALNEVLHRPKWHMYEIGVFEDYIVLEKTDEYVVYQEGSSVLFGYRGHIARHINYWEKDAGSSKKNGGFGSWDRASRTKAKKIITQWMEKLGEKLEPTVELVARTLVLEGAGFKDYVMESRFSALSDYEKITNLPTDKLTVAAGGVGLVDANGKAVADVISGNDGAYFLRIYDNQEPETQEFVDYEIVPLDEMPIDDMREVTLDETALELDGEDDEELDYFIDKWRTE